MTPDPLDAFFAAGDAATPGRWSWHLNLKGRDVTLESSAGMRAIVLSFARWGMAGVTAMFNVGGFLKPAHELGAVVPGREHHASWYQTIDHPDARFIEEASAARPALRALRDEREELREAIRGHLAEHDEYARQANFASCGCATCRRLRPALAPAPQATEGREEGRTT